MYQRLILLIFSEELFYRTHSGGSCQKRTIQIFWILCRNSRSQMLLKIVVLENFAIFTGKHLCWSLFLIKSPGLPGTHLIDHGSMKGWVDLGATQWFCIRDAWNGNPAPPPLNYCSKHLKKHLDVHSYQVFRVKSNFHKNSFIAYLLMAAWKVLFNRSFLYVMKFFNSLMSSLYHMDGGKWNW